MIDSSRAQEFRQAWLEGNTDVCCEYAGQLIETVIELWKVHGAAQGVSRERYFGRGSEGDKRLWELKRVLDAFNDVRYPSGPTGKAV